MKFISLFSGIGGFDLGLERAGMECIGQVENDPYCQAVLAYHWPQVKRIEDIRDVRRGDFDTAGLVCGGFPCQPFSQAGKRRGKEDDRYLWPEMLRVIKEYRPAWVLGENVAGIVSMELDNVLFDLESEGYKTQSFIIPACAVDAPHRRDRVWIVGHAQGAGQQARCFNGMGKGKQGSVYASHAGNVADPTSIESRGGFCQTGQMQIGNIASDRSETLADPDNAGFEERWGAESIQPEQHSDQCAHEDVFYSVNNKYDRAEGYEAKQGGDESNYRIFERDYTWEPEPGLGRVAHGVPGRVDRLRSLGNAVVPQVVEQIGRAILIADSSHD